MKDNRSDKVKQICADNIDVSCENCPLRQPCKPAVGDTKVVWDIRMNEAAESLEINSTDYLQGMKDCRDGAPHQSKGDDYDEGFACQYQHEQNMNALELGHE